MKNLILTAALLVASAAHADVLVLDYLPEPGVRLRLTSETSDACGVQAYGQFVYLPKGYTADMCWRHDEATDRIIVYYPDIKEFRAYAAEDLQMVTRRRKPAK